MGTFSNLQKAFATPKARYGERSANNLQTLLAAIDAVPGKNPGGKLILFSSTRRGEGKTTIIAELVRYIEARQSETIAVIDGARRHDLAAHLLPGAAKPLTLQQLVANASGQSPATADGRLVVAVADIDAPGTDAALVTGAAARQLAARFSYVFVELASVAESSRAAFSAKDFDGVILVIEAGHTRWPAIQNARDQLERAGLVIVGAFLNKRTFVIPNKIYEWL